MNTGFFKKNSHPPTCGHITPDPPAPPWSMLLPNACRHSNRNGCFFWRPFQAKWSNNIELGERGHASFFAMSLTGWLFFWRTWTTPENHEVHTDIERKRSKAQLFIYFPHILALFKKAQQIGLNTFLHLFLLSFNGFYMFAFLTTCYTFSTFLHWLNTSFTSLKPFGSQPGRLTTHPKHAWIGKVQKHRLYAGNRTFRVLGCLAFWCSFRDDGLGFIS